MPSQRNTSTSEGPLVCTPFAREWRDAQMAQLAATVGGGSIGPGPASIVSSAALQLAASRWLSDRGAEQGDARALVDASRLANDARQNVLAAFEIAAREATARPRDAMADLDRRLAAYTKPKPEETTK